MRRELKLWIQYQYQVYSGLNRTAAILNFDFRIKFQQTSFPGVFLWERVTNDRIYRWVPEDAFSYEWEVVAIRFVPCGDRAVSKHSDWLSNDFARCDWLNRMSSISYRGGNSVGVVGFPLIRNVDSIFLIA